MADPWAAVTNSQKQALALLGDAFEGVVRVGTAGVTDPTEAISKMFELVAAAGELATSTAVPLQNLLSGQRNLANAMDSFAQLQKELGEVVEKMAASHHAMLDALEGLAKPVVVAGDVIRREKRTPAKKTAKKTAQKTAPQPAKRTTKKG